MQAIHDGRYDDTDQQAGDERAGRGICPREGDQRAACAIIPTATGNASRRHGIEKKVPREATAHPAAITSMTKGTGGDGPAIARFAPTAVNPKRPPAQIRSTMTPA